MFTAISMLQRKDYLGGRAMNKSLFILLGLLLAAFLGGCGTQEAPLQKYTVLVDISDGTHSYHHSYSLLREENAFELLEEHIPLTYFNHSLGPYITSFYNLSANDSHYWALYVNSVYATKGIAGYTLSTDTNISWRLEKIE